MYSKINNLKLKIGITFFIFVAVFVCFQVKAEIIDCGLRTASGGKIIPLACDPIGTLTSKLRVSRYGGPTTTSGLVAHWSFNEASGNALDSTASGNTGTLVGNATRVTGKVGNALSLDGSGDYVNCGDNGTLDFGTSNFTITAWIKTSSSANYPAIISKENGYGSYGWNIVLENGTGKLRILIHADAGAYTFPSSPNLADGKWHFIGFTWNNSASDIAGYVDGVSVGTYHIFGYSGINLVNALSVMIGMQADGSGNDFNGLIDEVKIYNRILSGGEMFQIYGVKLVDITDSRASKVRVSSGGVVKAIMKYPLVATGGTITYTDSSGLNPTSEPYNGGYTVHTFSNIGSSSFNVLDEPIIADVLVVGGGASPASSGGGGGGGGVIYRPQLTLNSSTVVGVTVGAGGVVPCLYCDGYQGSDSVFGTLTAKGGGAGYRSGPGASGGSGGGGGYAGWAGGSGIQPSQSGESGTYGFGNNGGSGYAYVGNYPGGGGGGAGAPGTPAPNSSVPGNGGDGKAYSISGTSVYYGGGGGGAPGDYSDGNIGAAGLGGNYNGNGTYGGGGTSRNAYYGTYPFPGIQGVVIVRYLTNGTVPSAPTIGFAHSGNSQATIDFTPLPIGSQGGRPVTLYTATSNPGGFTAVGTTSPITVTGLTNGQSYTFTVTATNIIGTGPASSPSNSITAGSMFAASGGTVTIDEPYIIHSFTNSSDTFTVLSGSNLVNYFAIGGGGGGGDIGAAAGGSAGGGGGAGGVIQGTYTVSSSPGTYPLTIGVGGPTNTNGGDTLLFGKTAIGGGHGGQYPGYAGTAGGSGGGGGWSGGGGAATQPGSASGGLGNSGAAANNPYYIGGGGGGAGGAATNPYGGMYVTLTINGHSYGNYGGGGSGARSITSNPPGTTGVAGYGSIGAGAGYGGGTDNYPDYHVYTTGGTAQANTGSGGGGGGEHTYNGGWPPTYAGAGGSGKIYIWYQRDTQATGGTITYTDSSGLNPRSWPPHSGGYTVHTFTSSGNFNVGVANLNVSYLIVAGGGGGGGAVSEGAGASGAGGGAGGFRTGSGTVVAQSYPVVVGNGGPGGGCGANGTQGGNSSFNSVISVGGGYGGASYPNVGGNGGSGGGGAYTSGGLGTVGQGSDGASGAPPIYGGGGGGAGAVGSNSNGGAGLASLISGVSTYYAGGGGGGGGGGATTGSGGIGGGGAGRTAGTANTGGGGGGGDYGGSCAAASGGSGIVIIRYPTLY